MGSPRLERKAIAKVKLHVLGDLSREASQDLIGKPGILVRHGGPEGFGGKADVEKLDVGKDVGGNADGSKFALNGDGGGEDPIMEEGSKTDPGIRTHSPFGIAVVDIAHEGLGLDFSVDFNGDGGRFEPYRACETPVLMSWEKLSAGLPIPTFWYPHSISVEKPSLKA